MTEQIDGHTISLWYQNGETSGTFNCDTVDCTDTTTSSTQSLQTTTSSPSSTTSENNDNTHIIIYDWYLIKLIMVQQLLYIL